jgi:hypothetical protein
MLIDSPRHLGSISVLKSVHGIGRGCHCWLVQQCCFISTELLRTTIGQAEAGVSPDKAFSSEHKMDFESCYALYQRVVFGQPFLKSQNRRHIDEKASVIRS